eukprot:10365563-Ditylum_brightwellii.AAC.1
MEEGGATYSNSWATNLLFSLTGHSNNNTKGSLPNTIYASSTSCMASSDAHHKVTFQHDIKVVPMPMCNKYSRCLHTLVGRQGGAKTCCTEKCPGV